MAKEKKATKNRTTIYITDDLLWRMRAIAAKLRIDGTTNAVEAAVTFWADEMESRLATEHRNSPKSKGA